MANIANQTETKKLTISTTANVDVYMEVDLPYFCKKENIYFKVVSTTKALRVTDNTCISIVISNPQHSHTAREIAGCTAITENEFDKVAYAVLNDAEEIAKEKGGRFKDENEEIDQIRENQVA